MHKNTGKPVTGALVSTVVLLPAEELTYFIRVVAGRNRRIADFGQSYISLTFIRCDEWLRIRSFVYSPATDDMTFT
jgi:hypothetical protein